MNFVVGSGPAGIACAHALLESGKKVTLLDAGLHLEPERQAVVSRMKAGEPSDWSAADVAVVKEGLNASAKGVPLKLIFGSGFPYRNDGWLNATVSKTAVKPSFARGGFSNVWGAAILPYNADDLRGWPISENDLKPHFKSVASLTGVAGEHDDIEKMHALYHDNPMGLKTSGQIGEFFADARENRDRLSQAGFFIGKSRLAMGATGNRCRYCGMCLYGCPYDVIYKADFTIEELKKNPNFKYVPGVVVEGFAENAAGVEIRGKDAQTGGPVKFDGESLFIGAGVVPTAKIVLSSLGAANRDFKIIDSQYYLLPMLRWKATKNAMKESNYTISQAFVEIEDQRIDKNKVHLQLYSYNEWMGHAVNGALGPLKALAAPFIHLLLNRMLLFQGYLHSDSSGRVNLRMNSDGSLDLRAEINPETKAALRRLIIKLFKHSFALKAFPLFPLLDVTEVGRGFHYGGNFPMKANPSEFQCDVNGRLHGFKRVHIVDSSVFPTIPASTITMTSMANAHRIGALYK